MTASLTVRYNNSNNAQTLVTGSLTPAADSLWILVASANTDNHGDPFAWVTPAGGSESYTAIGALSQDNDNGDNFAWSQRVWTQQFGASPAARTVTIDAFDASTAIGINGLTIIEVTGHNTTTPFDETAKNFSTNASGTTNLNVTTTLASAPTSGNLVIAVTQVDTAATVTFDAPPTNYATDSTHAPATGIAAEVNSSSTTTATGVTHGTSAGDNYHVGLTVFEVADAAGASLTATVNDGGTEADAVTTVLDHARSPADGGTEADAATAVLDHARNPADGGTAGDTVAVAVDHNRTETDGGTAGDTVDATTGALALDVNDAGNAGDSGIASLSSGASTVVGITGVITDTSIEGVTSGQVVEGIIA